MFSTQLSHRNNPLFILRDDHHFYLWDEKKKHIKIVERVKSRAGLAEIIYFYMAISCKFRSSVLLL